MILRRKRGAMRQFEAYTATADDHVTLLRRIAGSTTTSTTSIGTRRNDFPRWVTVRSGHVDCNVILALVRVHGRRLLVAYDGGWLRAPTTADWRAASHSVPIEADCRAAKLTLVRALQEHVDEQELRKVGARCRDEMMQQRRKADEALLRADPVQRLAGARRFSLARRGIMQATRAAHLKRQGLASSYVGSELMLDAADHPVFMEPDTRIRLRAGIVIVPS